MYIDLLYVFIVCRMTIRFILDKQRRMLTARVCERLGYLGHYDLLIPTGTLKADTRETVFNRRRRTTTHKSMRGVTWVYMMVRLWIAAFSWTICPPSIFYHPLALQNAVTQLWGSAQETRESHCARSAVRPDGHGKHTDLIACRCVIHWASKSILFLLFLDTKRKADCLEIDF